MNYAVIFAGGVGQRMNSKAKPKQFLEIHGKAIIVYTIEHFEKHPEIDAIAVACTESWISYLKNLIEEANFKKVKWILPGGATALDSQYKCIAAIASNDVSREDIVLIHDGVRPLINYETITKCIATVKSKGSAITMAPATETIISVDDDDRIISTTRRSDCRLARAPQAFYLKDIFSMHERAYNEGKHDFIDSATMMQYYGKTIYTVEGPVENIKVTTPADFYICRALLDAKENSQIYGL